MESSSKRLSLCAYRLPMTPPRFYTLSISADAERIKAMRAEERQSLAYLIIERLMCGESAADVEFKHHGVRVDCRPAVSGEIIKPGCTE